MTYGICRHTPKRLLYGGIEGGRHTWTTNPKYAVRYATEAAATAHADDLHRATGFRLTVEPLDAMGVRRTEAEQLELVQ